MSRRLVLGNRSLTDFFGRRELHSYELMQKLMRDGSPSFFNIPASSPVHHALDLGCRYSHWFTHAARVWGAHGTKIIGLSMPPCDDEMQTALPKVPVDKESVKLLRHNLYVYIATKPRLGRSADRASSSQLASQSSSRFRTTLLIMCI